MPLIYMIPGTIRASMGTLFTVPRSQIAIPIDSSCTGLMILDKTMKDFKIVGSSASGDALIMDVDLATRPMALVIGNETHGLSYSYKQLCDPSCQDTYAWAHYFA